MATVRYLVHDVDTALAFYTKWLGFELIERWGPPFAIVTKGDLKLWLSGPETSAAKAMPDGRKPEPGGWNRLVIEVEELDALMQNLKEAGMHFRNEIVSGPGGKQILAEDPSGNPLELFEPRDS
ncbi:MAG: VOC family protein [Caldilineaceae bacterium]|nr:VOC family protein [Caldilineaceae bacterium]